MKHVITAFATIVIFGSVLFINEQHRRSDQPAIDSVRAQAVMGEHANGVVVRAAGRIEGRTEEIGIRARTLEQISQIHVRHGQQVTAGQVLVSLDALRLASERDLAAALVEEAVARKERLENGYRQSEIETARQHHQAAMAQAGGAKKAYDRALVLRKSHAISQQEVDDLYTDFNALQARAAAARASFETLDAPPRADEMLAAEAAIRAAESRLRIAQINFDRAQIRAPIDGRILAVEAKIGELTGPENVEPLLIMSDTARLRAVAEVDEYDALRVVIGQHCEIASDAAVGVIAKGRVAEIEPQMNPKQMIGQWAGERNDAFSRRVWIDLEDCDDFPIGLPVDVYIRATEVP